MPKKNITKARQKVFALRLDPPTRLRLSREHKQAYDAGMIDAYLNILGKIGNKKPNDWLTLVFDEPEARRYCFVALDFLLSTIQKQKAKIATQRRLLGELRQRHLDF